MSKVTIKVENVNKCSLHSKDHKLLNTMYEKFAVKHPNFFMLQRNANLKGWDGMVRFVSKFGIFDIGLLESTYDWLIRQGHDVEIIDERPSISSEPYLIENVGPYKLRDDQRGVLKSIITHKLNGIPYYIGIVDAAVNFGKTLIMAGLYLCFNREIKTLILLNDSDLFKQFKREIPELLPRENIGFIQGKKHLKFENFSVAMVQTLSSNLKTCQKDLSSIEMVLIDEVDAASNKTYQSVIQHLLRCTIRIGLSGTVYMSELKKNRLKNTQLRAFYGNPFSHVTIRKMINKGYSTKVVVKMIPVEDTRHIDEYLRMNYQQELQWYVTEITDKEYPGSYKTSLVRTQKYLDRGIKPILIITRYINHCNNLFEFYNKFLDRPGITMKAINHTTPDRDKIIKDFREGNLDILISTLIVARGKNLPLTRYLQNAASLDSQEKSIQILGRLLRLQEGKDKVYLDDLMYPGRFLSRHARHRKNYYIKQKLKVIDLEKLKNRNGKK